MSSDLIAIEQSITKADYTADLVKVRVDHARYPRVNETDPADSQRLMEHIVQMAYLYTGREGDPDMVTFIARELLAELLDPGRKLCNLSWYEVARAVRKGVLGMSKEMYGISVASLFLVIVDYVRGEGAKAEAEADKIRHPSTMSPAYRAAVESAGAALGKLLSSNTKKALQK